MHCEFTYTTNAFQDESWDLSNSKGYEFDIKQLKLLKFLGSERRILRYLFKVLFFIKINIKLRFL